MPRPRLAPGCFRAFGPAVAAGAAGSAALVSSSDGVFRKIRSPQTVGVEPLQAGIFTFHLMFCSVDHVSGRFFAAGAVPSPLGPRQLGQLDATAGPVANNSARPSKG